MNNDYLRVNSKSDDAEIVDSEFDVAKPEIVPEKKKVTFMTILFSGKKSRADGISVDLPSFKGGFTVFLSIALMSLVMLLVAILSKNTTFLIVDTFLISLMFPLSGIVMFSDLNLRKDLKIHEIICAIVVGVFAFIIVYFVENYISSVLRDYSTFANILNAITNDLFFFVLCVVYLRVARKADIFTEILICICIYSGYMMFWTATGLVSELFVAVPGNKTIFAIPSEVSKVNDLGSYMGIILQKGVYFPFLIYCKAVITAGVASLLTLPFRAAKEKNKTFYLFILIEILLHILSDYNPLTPSFKAIVPIICVAASFFCALRILNYALSVK